MDLTCGQYKYAGHCSSQYRCKRWSSVKKYIIALCVWGILYCAHVLHAVDPKWNDQHIIILFMEQATHPEWLSIYKQIEFYAERIELYKLTIQRVYWNLMDKLVLKRVTNECSALLRGNGIAIVSTNKQPPFAAVDLPFAFR